MITEYVKGKAVFFDECDADLFYGQSAWWWDKGIYLKRDKRKSERTPNTPKIYVFHRQIAARMGIDVDNLQVDHIDRNPSNNCRSNLRGATGSQNKQNSQQVRPNKASIYRGVYWKKDRDKWVSTIRNNGTRKHLGHFDNEIDAAMAYDRAAKELHGEYGILNFPPA